MIKNIIILFITASCLTDQIAPKPTQTLTIHDVSRVTTGTIKAIETPATLDELRTIITNTQGPLAIAGGRFSQGGHIWHEQGIAIDMKNLNKVTSFDIANKKITVQAGITWRELQKFIQQCNLSVKVMQSYNDFSVGGSLAVNVHGRDIAYGPLVDTIESIRIMLADGSIITVSRTEQYELFKLVCGGYGACGVITEVTLSLTDNVKIECSTQTMQITDYKKFFFSEIYKNPHVALHNANLYPNDYQDVVAVTWHTSSQPLTEESPLQKPKKIYVKEGFAGILLRYIPWFKRFRLPLETKAQSILPTNNTVVWRNHEMSATVASLEPLTRSITTPILQEYFIPFEALESFVDALRRTTKEYNINVLNVSIRYVSENNDSLLSYAKKECFALVLFINIPNTIASYEHTQKWTQTLINHALTLEGTYYLPYQLFATQKQFEQAYQNHTEFKELRKKYDPENKFSNTFLKTYLS